MRQVNFAFIGSGKTLRDCIDEVKQFSRSSDEYLINIKYVFIDPSKGVRLQMNVDKELI